MNFKVKGKKYLIISTEETSSFVDGGNDVILAIVWASAGGGRDSTSTPFATVVGILLQLQRVDPDVGVLEEEK